MFKIKKNEQNENTLCLKGMRRFRIMFTLFKFHFEHYKGRNWKI